jgi:hypothetical protein
MSEQTPKLDRIKFLILDNLNAWRVSAELQLESQSKPMGYFGFYRNILKDFGTG